MNLLPLLKGMRTLPAFSHATNRQCNGILSFNYYFIYCGNEKNNLSQK